MDTFCCNTKSYVSTRRSTASSGSVCVLDSNYFYRNSDSFLIPEVDSFQELYQYDIQNTFTRPIIYTVDNRLEYGDKRFIISNAGVLFSIHEFLENKLLGYDGQIDIDAVKIIREKTRIGTLGASFELEVCHLISIDS